MAEELHVIVLDDVSEYYVDSIIVLPSDSEDNVIVLQSNDAECDSIVEVQRNSSQNGLKYAKPTFNQLFEHDGVYSWVFKH